MDITALTFAVRYSKGVYVPLLASGVSRAAGIPTGYEVMRDLIKQLAAASQEPAPGDLEAWYVAQFDETPTYSRVLARLGVSAADRSRILQPYFEPSASDREIGRRVPTKAHRAIAQLAKAGYFRIILTTNFDDLMERALAEIDLRPVVISTPAAFSGMQPLPHIGLVVLKLNGDYRDLDTRNLPEELGSYDDAIRVVLERVVEEYGLIVCGWSADYDAGLRDAIAGARSRRFSLFWAHKGPLSTHAEGLAAQRDAQRIEISSAAALFSPLAVGVAALESQAASRGQSTELELARLKRLLQDDARYIDLEELGVDSARAARQRLDALQLSSSTPDPTKEAIAERVLTYEAAIGPLLPLIFCGGHWGRPRHADVWARMIRLLRPSTRPEDGYDLWRDLREYPAILSFYACGVGATLRRQSDTVAVLLRQTSVDVNGRISLWAESLDPWFVPGSGFKGLPNLADMKVPVSERLHSVLRGIGDSLGVPSEAFDDAFDDWELLLSLVHSDARAQAGLGHLAPLGRFCYRLRGAGARSAVNRLGPVLEQEGVWEFIQAGLFGGYKSRAQAAFRAMLTQPEMIAAGR